MINRIKCIVVDKLKEEHNYDDVVSENLFGNEETKFDFVFANEDDDFMKVFNEHRDFDCLLTIGNVDERCFEKLCGFSFQIRKKWGHIDKFEPELVAKRIIGVFIGNVGRENPRGNKLFSFFTCTFNTKKEYLYRLYMSMIMQTYNDWDWYVLDDSTNDDTIGILNAFKDDRIKIIKNVSNHGNIGFNKHLIAMACDGDYLVEVDHDDELMPYCLEYLNMAFEKFPDSDFVYSNALEYIDGIPCIYGEGWGWGEGLTSHEYIKGEIVEFSASPQINPFSIRTIYSQPNHVRCWKKDFYHRIGGHNIELGVLDDMDLLIRTFLNGKMTKVNKVLYVQYQVGRRGEGGENTQSKRFAEIQRTCRLLYERYDREIHERILELGHEDIAWDESIGHSVLWKAHKPGQEIMSNLLDI